MDQDSPQHLGPPLSRDMWRPTQQVAAR